MAKTVEEYISSQTAFKEELQKLREIILKTSLIETVKWGIPAYTVNGKNVVGIGAFKTYFGLWFFNGSFLKDEKNVLINAQEGKTRGMRQWRFDDAGQIDESLIFQYLEEAIQNQKAGRETKPEKKTLVIPDELKEALSADSTLAEAFDALTPGKRKEYAEYISEAKRLETKLSRLDKIKPMILSGKGLNDKYK